MSVIETDRLALRWLGENDAEFMLGLLNQPSFHRFIGDRGVRTAEQAARYLKDGPLASYATHGHGLYLVESLSDGAALGICGLLKRETLDHPDIGFAFLPEYWGQGYALESATAVMDYGRRELGMESVLAITSVDNERSIHLLEKLGFHLEGLVRLAPDDDPIKLFLNEAA